MRILILEDDATLRQSAATVLRSRGSAVDEAQTIAEADEKLFVTEYDAAVLDRSLPDGDAVDLVRTLRSRGDSTPVLFLTALDGVDERVNGLDAGADDYLVKPFAMSELLARLRSLARRPPVAQRPVLELEDLRVDPETLRAERGGRPLTLTGKEFAILSLLIGRAGRVVSRTEVIEHCWDEFADPQSNVVDVRIRLLRQKLGEPALLHTVRGSGYVLRA